jgi:hypothetical protein
MVLEKRFVTSSTGSRAWKLSIIIPCYNGREGTIMSIVEAVRAAALSFKGNVTSTTALSAPTRRTIL